MKKTIASLIILLAITVFLGAISVPVFAQDTTSRTPLEYTLLSGTSTPGLTNNPTFAGFIESVFKLALGAATVLAVLIIVIGGFTYMTSDSISGKKSGIEMLNNAVIGLLIALGAWLILNEINPKLLNFDLILPAVDVPAGPPSSAGREFGDDSQARSSLTASGVTVNKGNCQTVGQTNCTSLYQLPLSTVNSLKQLPSRCGGDGSRCVIIITGGTEHWLHKTHGPGKPIVDLSPTASLNRYITGSTAKPDWTCHQEKTVDGVKYSWESSSCSGASGDHWHVTF